MKKTLLGFTVALMACLVMHVTYVAAAGQCNGVKTSGLVTCDDANKGGPIVSLLAQIINFVAVGVGIVVVGGILYGSLLYVTSNGDSGRSQQGITTIVNAVIGLVLFIFMYAIVNFLVPGGLIG